MRAVRLHYVFVLLVALASCGGGDTLQVTSMQLGRSLNADNTVANHTTTFAPADTVYLSAVTTGSGSGTISVRWMYGNQVIAEPTKQVSSRDGTHHLFPLNNAGGFRPGDYSAEVFFNGQSAVKREFRVEQR